jgi:hypothetical protein
MTSVQHSNHQKQGCTLLWWYVVPYPGTPSSQTNSPHYGVYMGVCALRVAS